MRTMDLAHITIPFTVEIKPGIADIPESITKEIARIQSMIASYLTDDVFSCVINPIFDGPLYEIKETVFRQIRSNELLGECLNYAIGMIPTVMQGIKKDPFYMTDQVINGDFQVLDAPHYMAQALRETKMDFFYDDEIGRWGAECSGHRIHGETVELCIYRAWAFFHHGEYVKVPKKLSNGLGDKEEFAIVKSRSKA